MVNKFVLLFLMIVSAIAKNKPLLIGAGVTFILSFLSKDYILKLDKSILLNGGLTLLMIWMLMPLIESGEKLTLFDIKNSFNIYGIVAFLSGLLVVTAASKGLNLLNNNPAVLIGILLGSIVGVAFFGGIPVGMLTGSGIAYLIISLLLYLKNSSGI
jgi:uncharacterized membrane protein (DUF441 family)